MPRKYRVVILGALILALAGIALAALLSADPHLPVSPLPPSPLSPLPVHGATVARVVEPRAWLPLVMAPAPNLLVNPGFEAGYGGVCEWLENCTTTVAGCYDEQDIPAGWTGGWAHRCACNDGRTGLPEMRLAERWIDPQRIHSGDHAAQGFTFFRCGHWWWQQTFDLGAGKYQAGARIQTWHDRVWMRVCLDDVCSPWYSSPDEWREIVTPQASFDGQMVYRVECQVDWSTRNNDCYVDDAWLRTVGGGR